MKQADLEQLRRECQRAFVELWYHRDRSLWGRSLSQQVAHAKEEDRLATERLRLGTCFKKQNSPQTYDDECNRDFATICRSRHHSL
jgi:hypothetical protein